LNLLIPPEAGLTEPNEAPNAGAVGAMEGEKAPLIQRVHRLVVRIKVWEVWW
jgi:hypothetical protein